MEVSVAVMTSGTLKPSWCPRQESNLRTWLRRPMLYPLSYEGLLGFGPQTVSLSRTMQLRKTLTCVSLLRGRFGAVKICADHHL